MGRGQLQSLLCAVATVFSFCEHLFFQHCTRIRRACDSLLDEMLIAQC